MPGKKDASVPAVPAADEHAGPQQQELKEFTLDEVKKHNSRQDCWMIVRAQLRVIIFQCKQIYGGCVHLFHFERFQVCMSQDMSPLPLTWLPLFVSCIHESSWCTYILKMILS
jgi:hypothetical protein